MHHLSMSEGEEEGEKKRDRERGGLSPVFWRGGWHIDAGVCIRTNWAVFTETLQN